MDYAPSSPGRDRREMRRGVEARRLREQIRLNRSPLALRDLFAPPESAALRHEIRCDLFARRTWEVSGQASFVLDEFGDAGGVSCCFVRLAPREAPTATLVMDW